MIVTIIEFFFEETSGTQLGCYVIVIVVMYFMILVKVYLISPNSHLLIFNLVQFRRSSLF